MGGRNRWAYMGQPDFNPPNDKCQECVATGTSPSKTYFIGGKTVDGVAQYTWTCEHGHRWVIEEERK